MKLKQAIWQLRKDLRGKKIVFLPSDETYRRGIEHLKLQFPLMTCDEPLLTSDSLDILTLHEIDVIVLETYSDRVMLNELRQIEKERGWNVKVAREGIYDS